MVLSAGYFVFRLINKKLKVSTQLIVVVLYFLFVCVETIMVSGRLDEGLQKIFATPVLCFLCMLFLEKNPEGFFDVLSNILIVVLILNTTLFHPAIFRVMVGDVGNELIMFIGHVQVAAQIATLGLFVSYVLVLNKKRKKAYMLIFASFMTMFLSETMVSNVCMFLFIVAYIFRKKVGRVVNKINARFIFNVGCLLNILVVFMVLYKGFNFGARYYVWLSFLDIIREHWMWGYGVYGVLLKPFWFEWQTDALGMNYAHNELLQHILDGGIVLLVLYIILINILLKSAIRIKHSGTRFWSNICLIAFMIIAIPDGVSEYNFYYIFILLLTFFPRYEKML